MLEEVGSSFCSN